MNLEDRDYVDRYPGEAPEQKHESDIGLLLTGAGFNRLPQNLRRRTMTTLVWQRTTYSDARQSIRRYTSADDVTAYLGCRTKEIRFKTRLIQGLLESGANLQDAPADQRALTSKQAYLPYQVMKTRRRSAWPCSAYGECGTPAARVHSRQPREDIAACVMELSGDDGWESDLPVHPVCMTS